MKKLLILVIIIGCNRTKENVQQKDQSSLDKQTRAQVFVQYASAFDIEYDQGYKVVTLNTPWQGSSSSLKYVLRHKDTPVIDSIKSLGQEIIIPVENLVCNSTSQIVLLEELGLIDRLKGFPQTQYIYSPQIIERVKNGSITDVGIEAKMNIEGVLAIDPDMVMAFNTGRENRQLNKLKELGIPVVINADYLETSALGRAEWIKFMSVFFDKEKEANSYFDRMVNKYDSLVSLVNDVDKVNVFSGSLYGGSWFMPAAKNYGALLISDAGGEYLWNNDDNTGWLNLDFEVVYEKAQSTDVWIGVGGFESLSQLKEADPRYADFKAFKNRRVYSYVNRVNEAGANDYFESGVLKVDIVLADHIKMIHPELLPDYELYYYKQLQ
ncbi:ABC transporter substrate-binding protein [Reichenbachiella sp. MALMAid0571]|uniref:ABC transporter substrate-binding protein n=1 Tax=Reichenbachiella sp. MALMAid0571 TaxID=3143939 RepID=UPI0032DF20E7